MPEMRADSRTERDSRPPRQDRQSYGEQRGRGRYGEGQERPRYGEQQNGGLDRNGRGERRFQRPESTVDSATALPSFITAPVARPAPTEGPAPEAFGAGEHDEAPESDGVNFHLSARRRRRPRLAQDGAADAQVEAIEATSELPLES